MEDNHNPDFIQFKHLFIIFTVAVAFFITNITYPYNDWKNSQSYVVKADINNPNFKEHKSFDYAYFHNCVKSNDYNQVQSFIASCVDVNYKDSHKDGYSAIMYAVTIDDYNQDMIELLLDKDADVNSFENYGNSILMKACELCRFDIIELLVSKGADINRKNIDGWTALMYACKSCSIIVVDYLIKRKAKNLKNRYNQSIFEIANQFNNQAVIKYLKDKKF